MENYVTNSNKNNNINNANNQAQVEINMPTISIGSTMVSVFVSFIPSEYFLELCVLDFSYSLEVLSYIPSDSSFHSFYDLIFSIMLILN